VAPFKNGGESHPSISIPFSCIWAILGGTGPYPQDRSRILTTAWNINLPLSIGDDVGVIDALLAEQEQQTAKGRLPSHRRKTLCAPLKTSMLPKLL
jgi:hypothetical protein